MRPPIGHSRGFTLLEIALAVAVLAMMTALTWGSISRGFDAYENVSQIDEKVHNVRLAMNRMAREIGMAFLTQPSRDLGQEPVWKTVFRADAESHGHRLDFTSFAHEVQREDAKESEECEIGYFVERDETNRDQWNLMRREDPRVDRSPDKGGRAFVLAKGIKSFELRFFDPKDEEWRPDWDSETPDYLGRLPTLVEVKLVLINADKKEESFITKTRIALPQALAKF